MTAFGSKLIDVDLGELRRKVEIEIDEYVYRIPDGTVGKPWSSEKVQHQLLAFRNALVDPYWVEIIDDNKNRKSCVAVADDKKTHVLIFDAEAQMFMLVMKKDNELISFGVDGDAVGCFLAR